MGSNKSKYIDKDNIGQWLSALGFSFPRNEAEEKIFDKVYSKYEHKLKESKIDALKLINEVEKHESVLENEKVEWRMAARNYGDLPEHIIKKMRKNQNGQKGSCQKD